VLYNKGFLASAVKQRLLSFYIFFIFGARGFEPLITVPKTIALPLGYAPGVLA
jgi:hypothetical protein